MGLTPIEMQAYIARQDFVAKQELDKEEIAKRKKQVDDEHSRRFALKKASSVDEPTEDTEISHLSEDKTVILAEHHKKTEEKADGAEKVYYKDQDLGSKIDILT